MDKTSKARIAILRAIQESGGAIGASKLADRILHMGVSLRPRSIRLYLEQMDGDGLTRFVSRRRGREITARGCEELDRANVLAKIGFVSARVDVLGYKMTFSSRSGEGTVIANVTTIRQKDLPKALAIMECVFKQRLSMGNRIIVAGPEETLGGVRIPPGQVGIGTICSVSINGILLEEGIPVTSRFGGLMEIRDREPVRFVQLIDYSGTTIDPLEAFIKAGMTKVRACAEKGSGIVGASFREVPSVAVDDIFRIRRNLEEVGLGGILLLGKPSVPLLDIPVAEGRTGMIVVGGMNPVAAMHESGVEVAMQSLAGLEEYSKFHDFSEICRQYAGKAKI